MNKIFQKISDYFKSAFLRVPAQEQAIFARHLAVMSKAGLPLLQSLKMIRKESRSRSMQKILDQVIDDVTNGQFLSSSLEKYINIFGNLFINIIRVGESAGILSENLTYLADELKKGQELKKKVIGAMIYPIVILIATFGITGLLTVFIFPKILPVFKTLNVDLPFSTRVLINLSNAVTNYGLALFLGLVALIVLIIILLKIKPIKYAAHQLILLTPLFGKIIRDVNLSNFTRTLGLTLKSGVKVVEAINITGHSLSNLVFKRHLAQVAEEVRRGEPIGPYFEKRRRLFPSIVSQMVAVGETAGKLSETLLYLSEFYEGEVSDTTKNLSNTLEPILMVLMGTIVGFIAISIITPIYEVTSTVGF